MSNTAYSYIRFSTARQHNGDSLRRQLQLARAYATAHDLTLDETLTFQDLGVSAFDKSNLERGALAAFLQAVKSGEVAPGSFLLVEAFDRLSRAEVPTALRLLFDLLSAGINVVTLNDGRVWSAETISDISNLLVSILFMAKAHDESGLKSTRLKAVWSKKRSELPGKILTKEVPRWLRVNADRTGFIVERDKAESVRKVYRHAAAGLGKVGITRLANQEAWPVPGKGQTWHSSLVSRLLTNRAVLGEFQPHETKSGKREPTGDPILGYFPAIIDEGLFHRARAARNRHAALPARRDSSYRNIFQGLLRCGCCGASYVRKNKADLKYPTYARYYCTNRVRAITRCASFACNELEFHLVGALVKHHFGRFARKQNAIRLQERLNALEAERASAEVRIQRLLSALESTHKPLESVVERLEEAEQVLASLRADIQKTRDDLELLATRATPKQYQGALDEILLRVNDPDASLFRAQLRDQVAGVVDTIHIFPNERIAAIKWRGAAEVIAVALGTDSALPELLTNGTTLPIPRTDSASRARVAGQYPTACL